MPETSADLKNVLFPVECRSIYLASDSDESGDDESRPSLPTTYRRIRRFRAVVDIQRDRVFAVVAEDYRLVTNAEALDLGKSCFGKVFSQPTARSMKVFNVTTPSTRSFCHVDFIHEQGGFEPWQGDKWVPYLRVTNSYNRTKPLRFDLGFCRWICTNGMIFGSKHIRFRYLHTKGAVGSVEFHTTFGELKQLEKEFIEQVHNLKRYYVPEDVMLALACRVFGIRASRNDFEKPRRAEQLTEFRDRVLSLTRTYFDALGSNGYAALNVLTDFPTRPLAYISPESMVDRLQKRSGDWVGAWALAGCRRLPGSKRRFQCRC